MSGRPRSRRKRRLALLGAAAALVVVALFLVVYFVVFPTSSPKPFKLPQQQATGTSTPPSTGNVAGRWTVATGSQAGYRVREKLVFLPAESDAVGRTGQVTGTARVAAAGGELTISAASFTVAVETLKSDRSLRDEKLRQIGLESERYPTATFVLTKPARVPLAAVSGHALKTTVTGRLQIHGVSRLQRIPVELLLSGDVLEAAGALSFPWSRFGMTAPSIAGFVNVTGTATMEFELRLRRS